MRFIAIDVETANANFASICQIGIVEFVDSAEASSQSIMIDPEDYFDEVNISIHGLDESCILGMPSFASVRNDLADFIGDDIAVCHTHFDRVALHRSCERYGSPSFGHPWLDSARVARRAWSEVRDRGYGLADLARRFDLPLNHHDAVSDARCAGLVLLRAVAETGIPVKQWLHQSQLPHQQRPKSPAIREKLQNIQPLEGTAGEMIVFTGALTMRRADATEIAQAAGFRVGASVTRKTTILVVGDQDIRRSGAIYKSDKHRRAEELMAAGQIIRIVAEGDFIAMTGMPGA